MYRIGKPAVIPVLLVFALLTAATAAASGGTPELKVYVPSRTAVVLQRKAAGEEGRT